MLQWFNRLLSELWPYYDKAIAKTVKEVVEPIMDEYKPPGLIKRIFFKNLTFGGAPMRAEHVWVEEKSSSHVLFEVRHPFPTFQAKRRNCCPRLGAVDDPGGAGVLKWGLEI